MLAAGAFDLRAQDVSNRGGTVLHSGNTDTRLAVLGKLDNSGGVLASNAQRLTIDAGRLVNEDGKITHAGTGGLMLNAGRVDGARGETATAGAATLRLGVVDHRQAALSASQIDVAAQSFDNRGGKLIATEADASRIAAAEILDNGDGGLIAGNGDLACAPARSPTRAARSCTPATVAWTSPRGPCWVRKARSPAMAGWR